MKWKIGGGLSSSSPPPLPIFRDNVLRTFWQEAPEQNLRSPPEHLRPAFAPQAPLKQLFLHPHHRNFRRKALIHSLLLEWAPELPSSIPIEWHLFQPPTTSELRVSSVIVKCCSIYCWRQTNRVNLIESLMVWWVVVGVYVGFKGNVSLKLAPVMKKSSQLEILIISYL